MELLNFQTHQQYEKESLGCFPRESDGSINWDSAGSDVLARYAEADVSAVEEAIRRFMPDEGDLIFVWGSVVIPSLRIGKEASLASMSKIWEFSPEFWVYSARSRILMEISFSGALTVTKVPPKGCPVTAGHR